MRLALSIMSAFPTRTDPTGAPSPLDKQIETESKGAANSDIGIPKATDALNARAPSK